VLFFFAMGWERTMPRSMGDFIILGAINIYIYILRALTPIGRNDSLFFLLHPRRCHRRFDDRRHHQSDRSVVRFSVTSRAEPHFL
jgi:hypothetical protein